MNSPDHWITDSETTLHFGLICAGTVVAATLAGRYLEHLIRKRKAVHTMDLTGFVFLKHVLVVTLYLVGIGWALLSLPISKSYAHTLLAGAGASTIILGLAAQQIIGNLFAGVFLVLDRRFRIADVIEVQSMRGTVRELNILTTVIMNDQLDRIVIPNSLLVNGIIKKIRKPDADVGDTDASPAERPV